ncbi:hypothetical protein LIT25_09000 [Bacillus sp. F19]|nr:hypothetical protein LIT25_09000 [Bacillus sp. F19]
MRTFILLLTAVLFLSGCKQQDQSQRTFLIPEGYTGWVTVHNDPSAEENVKEYKVNKEGHASVNEKNIHDGWAATNYFYLDKDGDRKELSPGKMIHGASSGDETGKDGEAYFFVGDKKMFETTEYVPEDR